MKSEGYMITSQWGQGYPYNLDVPNNFLVGCVGTATSQLMRYYRWPLSGTGILPAYADIPAVELAEYTYAWDEMPDRATNTMTDEEKQNVSLISYHLAMGSQAQFGPETPASYNLLAGIMRDHFGYDGDVTQTVFDSEADSYTEADMTKIVTRSLLSGHPVLLGGGTHAFIVDGINLNDPDLFHFNFGFEGLHDGFYRLMKPFIYTPVNLLVYGIIPARANPIQLTSTLLSNETSGALFHGDTLYLSGSLNNGTPAGVRVAAFITTLSGIPIDMIGDETGLSGGASGVTLTLNVKVPEDCSVGPRRLALFWREDVPGADWRRIHGAKDGIVDAVEVTLEYRQEQDIFLKKSLPDLRNIAAGQPFNVDVITSSITLPGTLFLCVVDKNNNVLSMPAKSEALPAVGGHTLVIRLTGEVPLEDADLEQRVMVFYQREGEQYLSPLPSETGDIINSATLRAVMIYPAAEHLSMTSITGLPPDKILSWDRNINFTFRIKAEEYDNRGSTTEVMVNITDSEGEVISGIAGDSYRVLIPVNGEVDVTSNISFLQLTNVPEGEYRLNILVRYPMDPYPNYHLIPPAGPDITNPVVVHIDHPVYTQFLRMAEPLSIPDSLSAAEAFELGVACSLEGIPAGLPDGFYYIFNSTIIFTSLLDGAIYNVGSQTYSAIILGEVDIWRYACDLSNLVPGEYSVSVQVMDGYDNAKGVSVLQGLTAEIPSFYNVTVKV
jgi:hypothetical protein